MPGAPGRSGGDRVSSGKDGFPQSQLQMPLDLNEVEQLVWSQITGMLPDELLKEIDCFQLRILCECWVHRERLWERINADPTDDKAGRLYLQYTQHIDRLSKQFGMSPADRGRLKFEPAKADDDAEEWMKE